MAQHQDGRAGRGSGSAVGTHAGFLQCGGRETGQDQTQLRAAVSQALQKTHRAAFPGDAARHAAPAHLPVSNPDYR